jgi:hypothetical protein
LGRSSCETRYCPDHWRDWCEDAVVAGVARLAAYREAVDGAEEAMAHAVASPPQDRRYSVDQLWETRSEAYDALEAAGAPGGVQVTHPYRTNERGDLLYETASENGDVDDRTGRWAFLRDLADGWEEFAEYVEASPHYHALVPTNYLDGEAVPDGWVVRNMRKLGRFHRGDIESYREMVAPLYYVLTHGGVQRGRDTRTYFGAVHPASFDPAEELTATAWDKIQRMAEKAVKGEDDGGAVGPKECPREECEALVKSLAYLEDYLENEEWVSNLRNQRDGRERWLRLRGVLLWTKNMTDRPPPRSRRDREAMLEWLEERGRATTPEPSQVSLGGAMREFWEEG